MDTFTLQSSIGQISVSLAQRVYPANDFSLPLQKVEKLFSHKLPPFRIARKRSGNNNDQPTKQNDFGRVLAMQGQFDEESGDIQLNVEQSVSGTVAKGKILMIGGRVMAIQGPIAEPGYEIDALDAAILQLQLVD